MGMWAWTIFLVYVIKIQNQFVTNPNLENRMYHATKSSFSHLSTCHVHLKGAQVWRDVADKGSKHLRGPIGVSIGEAHGEAPTL